MGRPTAVVTALEERQEVVEASYDTQADPYHVRYAEGALTGDDLLEVIRKNGGERGLSYAPSLVHSSPPEPDDGEEAP